MLEAQLKRRDEFEGACHAAPMVEEPIPFIEDVGADIADSQLCNIVSSWQKTRWYRNCLVADEAMRNNSQILNKSRSYINSAGEVKENRTKANNRINLGIYSNIVSQKATFLCGQPITFSSDNKRLEELLEMLGESGFNLDMLSIADAIIGYGCCMTLTYIDGITGAPALKVIKPTEFIPFFRSDSPKTCSSFIHFYGKSIVGDHGDIEERSCIDYYNGNEKRTIEYQYVNSIPNVLRTNRVNIISYESTVGEVTTELKESRSLYQMWRSDDDCQPVLTRIKSAIDAYNSIISSGADRCYDQSGQIIVLTGVSQAAAKDSDKIAKAIHENSMLVLGCNGTDAKQDVHIASHSFESGAYMPMLTALHASIFSNATCVDIQRDSLQNTSGAAIRFKYEPMYFDALRTQSFIEGNIRRYIDFILSNYLYVNMRDRSGNRFDDVDNGALYKIIFNFDLPANEAEIINSIVAAIKSGIISVDEARKNIPWAEALPSLSNNLESEVTNDVESE